MKTERIIGLETFNLRVLFTIIALFMIGINALFSQEVTTQNTPGSYSFTVPQWVTQLTVEAWGAGGGGSATVINGAKEGGGGGAYARSILTVLPETSFNYTVGAGGREGADGGSSSFDVLVLADGGKTDRLSGLASASTGQIRI